MLGDPPPARGGLPFSFTTTKAAYRTSAGVYHDGKKVRKLWDNVVYDAGRHTMAWDGRTDDGQQAADGDYQIMVLKSGVEFTWLGTAFNSSDETSGASKWHGDRLSGMAFCGNKGFALHAYLEGNVQLDMFDVAHPGSKTSLGGLIHQTGMKLCGDGKRVYALAYGDYSPVLSLVYAFNADGTEATFAAGKPWPFNAPQQQWMHPSVIAVKYSANAANIPHQEDTCTYSGIAVQRDGRCLFLCRQNDQRIDIYDKATGAAIGQLDTHAYARITALFNMTCDMQGNPWITATKDGISVLQQFLVDGQGKVKGLGVAALGNNAPTCLAASPDGSTLISVDSTTQQIRAFKIADGSPAWTLGQAGGYYASTVVANDRFAFSDDWGGAGYVFLAYQEDGSFWVGDDGNHRYLHFSAKRDYLDQIAFLPAAYGMSVDLNKPTRIYQNYLEAAVDRSAKDVQKVGKGWTLTRNFGAKIPATVESFECFKETTTFTNGRTYSSVRNRKEIRRQIVELSDSGVRFTGVYFDFGSHVDKDGNLWNLGTGGPGTGVALFRQPVTGFDKDNNPVYGEKATYCGYPKYQETLPYGANPTAVSAKNGMAIFFGPGNHDGWHLGAVAKGGTDFAWLAAPSTGQGYQGAFPTDGYFQNGNGTNYPGGLQHVAGDFIFWNEHDEFYKASGQVNKWHVTDMNGLEVGVWGVTQSLREQQPEGAPWNAGNAVSSNVVQLDASTFEICHSDESRHGGLHRERGEHFDTVAYETIALKVHGPTPPIIDPYLRLLDGVQKFGVLENGVAGWTADANMADNSFYTRTNYGTYDPLQPPDLYVSGGYAGDKTVSRTLPGKGRPWELVGSIYFGTGVSNGMFTPSSFLYLKVYDSKNRPLAVIENHNKDFGQYGHPSLFAINGTTVYEATDPFAPGPLVRTWAPFKLAASTAGLRFTYQGNTVTVPPQDPKGEILNPARFAIEFSGKASGIDVDLKELGFRSE